MAQLLPALATLVISAAVCYLVVVAAAAVAGALARGGRRERAVDAYEALAVSRFTIPASIIVPISGDTAPVAGCIRTLLALNYPESEIIVVTDDLDPSVFAALRDEWQLEPKEFFYRRTLETAAVRRIYDSRRDSRLVVVEKARGGHADALNCGVSLARFRYIVTVSPEVECDAGALLRLMSPALRDPATVLAVTSYVERRNRMITGAAGDPIEQVKASDDYQRLASIRSWMASRLAWHQLRCGLPPAEAVIAWRRDAVLELDGFSSVAADPELDLLVRLQTAQQQRSGRVVRTSEVFGHAPARTTLQYAETANRRLQAVMQALGTFWRSPNAASRLTLMFVLALELLTPLAQGIVLTAAIGGAAVGLVRWTSPLIAIVMLAFGYAVVSASALLLRGGTPDAPVGKDLVRLLLRAPLEFAVYRPALTWRRFVG